MREAIDRLLKAAAGIGRFHAVADPLVIEAIRELDERLTAIEKRHVDEDNGMKALQDWKEDARKTGNYDRPLTDFLPK